MAVKIQYRRDSAANWTSNNPVLSAGEPGFETDTGKFKIGDGATAWSSLVYASVQSGGNISDFTNDAGYLTNADVTDGTLTVEVHNSGDLVGSVFAKDSSLLVDAENGFIPGRVISGAITTANIEGDESLTLAAGGVAGADIVISAANNGVSNGGDVTVNAGTGNVPSNNGQVKIGESNTSTVAIGANGNITTIKSTNIVVGDASGVTNFYGSNVFRNTVNFSNVTSITGFKGDVTGSVFADDSTLLVDAVSGTIPYSVLSGVPTQTLDSVTDNGTTTENILNVGGIIGDVTGSVFADDSSIMIDALKGQVVGPVKFDDGVGTELSTLGNILAIGANGVTIAAGGTNTITIGSATTTNAIRVNAQTGNTPADAVTVTEWLEVNINGNTRYIPLYT